MHCLLVKDSVDIQLDLVASAKGELLDAFTGVEREKAEDEETHEIIEKIKEFDMDKYSNDFARGNWQGKKAAKLKRASRKEMDEMAEHTLDVHAMYFLKRGLIPGDDADNAIVISDEEGHGRSKDVDMDDAAEEQENISFDHIRSDDDDDQTSSKPSRRAGQSTSTSSPRQDSDSDSDRPPAVQGKAPVDRTTARDPLSATATSPSKKGKSKLVKAKEPKRRKSISKKKLGYDPMLPLEDVDLEDDEEDQDADRSTCLFFILRGDI